MELTPWMESVAFEAMAGNRAHPVDERLAMALRALELVRQEEPKRIKAAVVDSLWRAHRIANQDGLNAVRNTADQVGCWTPSGTGDCPVCDWMGGCEPGCPLEMLRSELE